MGIPGYSAFFKEEYPSAVTSFKWRQQHATAGASAAQRPSVSLVSPTSAAEEVVIQNRHYDHLLFDINQFLYSAAAKSENEEQVFVRTFSQLNRIFQIFRPHASVFLAQDGPAPVAKFMTQRERRVKKVEKAKAKEELLSMSSLEEEAEEEDESKGTEEDEAEEEGEAVNETIATNGKRFDPINFTPGTPFMQRLKQALCYFACQRLNQLPLQNVAFYVSGSDREGEGELKIFEYLAYNESVLSTDRCLVVGNDADLILYAMMAYTNVDILQCDYGTYHLFNMSTFKKLLHQQVPNAPLEELLMDLTFISLLAGNDYLPKLRGLSLPETWKSYLHLRTTKEYENKRLFNLEESHLDVPFFAQIWAMQKFQIALKDSRKSEQNVRSIFHYMRSKYLVGSAASNLFQKEKSEQGSKLLTYSLKLNGVKLGTATAKSGKEAQTILCRQALGILNEDSESSKVTIDASSSPLFKMMKEQHKGITEDFYYSAIANYWDDITVIGVDSVASTIENQVTKTYQRKKKNTELITALTPEQIASRVKQYMQGIVWAMHYLQGKCIDYSYHYPLAISPQPTEVIEHVPHVDFRCAHSDTTPPLPLPFLMALLPSNSPHLKSHLPEAYQHLLETSSELADLYHGETEEQWASTSPLSLFERFFFCLLVFNFLANRLMTYTITD
ncbi:hypothetical protein QOT17_005121 [Balamuthia mandrillaris]